MKMYVQIARISTVLFLIWIGVLIIDYLDQPVVYVSSTTGRCVKVENAPNAKKQFDCLSVVTERYTVVHVR